MSISFRGNSQNKIVIWQYFKLRIILRSNAEKIRFCLKLNVSVLTCPPRTVAKNDAVLRDKIRREAKQPVHSKISKTQQKTSERQHIGDSGEKEGMASAN